MIMFSFSLYKLCVLCLLFSGDHSKSSMWQCFLLDVGQLDFGGFLLEHLFLGVEGGFSEKFGDCPPHPPHTHPCLVLGEGQFLCALQITPSLGWGGQKVLREHFHSSSSQN